MHKNIEIKNEEFSSAISANTIEAKLYLNNLIKDGLPMKFAKQNKPIVKIMIEHNIMPRKTWENALKIKSKRLTPLNSERLLRTIRIIKLAKQAFGDKAGNEWVERPTSVFNDKAPIEMLANEPGSKAVELLLNRSMHGFNA